MQRHEHKHVGGESQIGPRILLLLLLLLLLIIMLVPVTIPATYLGLASCQASAATHYAPTIKDQD